MSGVLHAVLNSAAWEVDRARKQAEALRLMAAIGEAGLLPLYGTVGELGVIDSTNLMPDPEGLRGLAPTWTSAGGVIVAEEGSAPAGWERCMMLVAAGGAHGSISALSLAQNGSGPTSATAYVLVEIPVAATLSLIGPIVFPSVTDSFVRAEEEEAPLSAGGKWAVIAGALGTGEVYTNLWRPKESYPNEYAARWTVAEFTNPAVTLEVYEMPENLERYFGVWACLAASAKSGYLVRCVETEEEVVTVTIEKWVAGTKTVLATLPGQDFNPRDTIGITVSSGKVQAWRQHNGTWQKLIEAADATYTKGYGGILAAGNSARYRNFAIGEAHIAATETSESVPAAAGWQLIELQLAEAPEGPLTLTLASNANMTAGEALRMTGVTICRNSDPGGPFSGDKLDYQKNPGILEGEDESEEAPFLANANYAYTWTGARGASTSVRYGRLFDFLALLERQAQLDTAPVGQSVEQRRAFLQARFQARHRPSGSTFVELITKLIQQDQASFSKENVRVVEFYANRSFYLEIDYAPSALMAARVQRLVEDIKPAHLAFEGPDGPIVWGTFVLAPSPIAGKLDTTPL